MKQIRRVSDLDEFAGRCPRWRDSTMTKHFRAYLRSDWEQSGERLYESADDPLGELLTRVESEAVVYEADDLNDYMRQRFIIEWLPEDEQMRRDGQPGLFDAMPIATDAPRPVRVEPERGTAWGWNRPPGFGDKKEKRRPGR